MSYNIKKSNGSTLLQLNDGQTDNVSSSITFIGRNYLNFGEIQNNNLLHLLENFADISPPQYPLTGQLWFDSNTTTNLLKVFNTQWQPLSVLEYSTASTIATSIGNLWYDPDYKQLFINTGTGFTLIGPDTIRGYGTTRFVSETLKDTENVLHPVIKCVIDNNVVYTVSDDDFVTSSTNLIPGISRVYKGITLKDGDLPGSSTATVVGTGLYAINANKLLAANSTATYIAASTATTANTIVQRNSQGYITASGLQTSLITATSGVLSGAWTVVNGLTPQSTELIDLGTMSLKWRDIYSRTSNATTVNANVINFSTLIDQNLRGITSFDTDIALTANSDSRLATQRAIKKYIDDQIAAEITTRLATDTILQNQISAIPVFPAGTIMYTASAIPPIGFFECNGELKNKTTFATLFAALGAQYNYDVTRFRLPDLRGYFIRSLSSSTGIDGGRVLGSIQPDDIKSHTHPYIDTFYSEVGGNPEFGRKIGSAKTDYDNYDHNYNRTTSAVGGTETRPKNIALMAIIKY
jgi:microcystin-dependent protein